MLPFPDLHNHALAPCPVQAQYGPNGWSLDIPRRSWVGRLTPTLEDMLRAPDKGWPADTDSDVHGGRVGPWWVRIARDGSLITRAGPTILPVPLVLTRPGDSIAETGKAYWDGVDKGWLRQALSAIAISLHGHAITQVGNPTPKANAWALWWAPGDWAPQPVWHRTLTEVNTLVSALLGPAFYGHPVFISLEGALPRPDGTITPAHISYDANPRVEAGLHHLLAPLLTRTSAVASAWTATRSVPSGVSGACITRRPVFQSRHTLPIPSAHTILAARHDPAYATLRAALQ